MSVLIDGEWCKDGSGHALKLGSTFMGKIRQRGGDSIYSKCWVVSLNDLQVQEVGPDPDFARAFVEHLICKELTNIVPAYKLIKARVPPPECFWGQGAHTKWYNWKEDRAAEGRVFVQPTLRQVHAAIKGKW